MSDTTFTPATETERQLVRPHDDRVVAGVCAGLARYFDMSPLVYRVAFAALVLLGGAGLVLYVAAWLVIPDERRGDSVIGEALRDRRRRPWLLLGIGLVGLALAAGLGGEPFWPDAGGFWIVVLVIGIVLLWWQTGDRGRRRPALAAATARTEPVGAPQPGAPTAGAEPVAAPPPDGRRLPVFLPTIGVLVAGMGVLGILEATDAVDVDWALALTVAVVLVGIAIAVGAFVGGVGALAAVGVLLATAMVAVVSLDVPLEGPIGERTERPATVRELDDEYRQSIGELELDLRALALPPGTTEIETSVGIGELRVLVPSGARVEVDAHVSAGELRVFAEDGGSFALEASGRDVGGTAFQEGAGPGAPTLRLETKVGFGALEVRGG